LSFEISEHDVLGRIGKLDTKGGALETPALLPVVNPLAQEISPRVMFERIGCKALITNAYLIKRRAGGNEIAKIHDFLDFPGIIATDSGAYQILRYGEVEVSPAEIVQYQQSIQTDIGVILDVPTGSRASKPRAIETVNETIRSADEALKVIKKRDIAWVGPIQGGLYPDLVAHCAREMCKREFDIYALGSPTEVMEHYLFADLVDMISAAKRNIPSSAPLHLFGAGHPFMFALAVALGCDLFDSAAYILYARRGRYLTEAGTLQLGQMTYFPCRCSVCSKTSPDEVRTGSVAERTRFLAEHNLSACFQEIETIKEAIVEGRLWELLEIRCRSHPSLFEALRRTKEHRDHMARSAPSTKTKGIFFFDSVSLQRPEHSMYVERLTRHYVPPRSARTALLVPATRIRPKSPDKSVRDKLESVASGTHVWLYCPPYGVVPSELEDTFPFSQTEGLMDPDLGTVRAMAGTIEAFLAKNRIYRRLVLVRTGEKWQTDFAGICRRVCRKLGVKFSATSDHELLNGRIRILGRRNRYADKITRRRVQQHP